MRESTTRDQPALSNQAAARLHDLEAQGVDVSLLVEQLRLSPTARIESMLRLRELCSALVEAGKRSDRARPQGVPSRERAI